MMHEAGVVDLARALIRTPSVNPSLEPGGSGEAEIVSLVAGWLRSWGFDVERVEPEPGRPSVLATLDRGSGRALLLSGHLDTVGVEGMEINPFAADVSGGRLWGRGACDMKGGVAAILAAARSAADTGFTGRLMVALTADEEESALGCRALVAAGLRADAAIICEPTGLRIMPAHKGFTWVRVDFRGEAAHGSRPDRGVDAIRHAGLFLARLDEIEATLTRRAPHPLLGHGTLHAGTIAGGTAPSVYPSCCRLVLERRTLPGESASAVRSEIDFLLAKLRTLEPSLDADLEVLLHREGSELDPGHSLVDGLAAAMKAAGLEPEVAGMTAWVEAELLNAAGTPTLCFGPGRIEDAHSARESVDVAELDVAATVLLAFLQSYLA
jgi:acetylornithine deacetylase